MHALDMLDFLTERFDVLVVVLSGQWEVLLYRPCFCSFLRTECGELCPFPGLQGASAAVEVDRGWPGLEPAVVPLVPPLDEA